MKGGIGAAEFNGETSTRWPKFMRQNPQGWPHWFACS